MLSPMIKATLQAAVLSCISNFLGQIVDAYRHQRSFTLNLIELLRFVVLTLITAPPNYKWQQALERWFPGYHGEISPDLPLTEKDLEKGMEKEKAHSSRRGQGAESKKRKLNIKNTLIKWFIDCMSVGALMNTVAFFAIMGLLKGQSSDQIRKTVRHETIPLILTGFRVWPIVSIISFSFVPVERRIVFGSAVGLLWGIYMSLIAARV